MDKSLFGMLGLANRGRKILLGETAFNALSTRKISLFLLASDASDNSKKKCFDKAKFYHIEVIECENKKDFGEAIGKGLVSVIGIIDKNIAEKIKKIMKVGD